MAKVTKEVTIRTTPKSAQPATRSTSPDPTAFVPNRAADVQAICAAHPEAFPPGDANDLRFNPGPGSTGLTILANTVLNNQGEGIYISGAQTGTQVHSNIAYASGGGDFVDLGIGTVVGQNLFGVDPLVVNAAAGDVHLTAGSPARGVGVGHPQIPTDFYGAPRPVSGACDGGAAQFVP